MNTTRKTKKNIKDQSFIVRYVPREGGGAPPLKGSEMDADPMFHVESAGAFADFAADIRASKFCAGGVGDKYKDDALGKTSFLISLYVYDKHLNERLAGFMTARVLPSGTLYMEMICTNSAHYRGVGSILLSYLERVKSVMKSRKIMLNSVPEAVGFYEKHGFTKKRKFNLKTEGLPERVDPGYHVVHRMTKKNRTRRSVKND